MAVNTNTTKTIEKASTVLESKCEETRKNMEKLMHSAGVAEYDTERVMVPAMPGCKDDVVFVGLNGAGFYFKRGERAEMPTPIAEILRNCGEI